MSDKTSLGDRMKSYEDISRIQLPRKSFVLCRIDGKAFHTYTKGLKRPFDEELVEDMNKTAMDLCRQIQGAVFAYVQSDEISIFIHEKEIDSQAWFDYNLQKMASVAASIATSEFNRHRYARDLIKFLKDPESNENHGLGMLGIGFATKKLANFDARFWTLPTVNEVVNYFIWRQQDATRNSISSVAQSLYSQRELLGISSNQQQEMIFQKGINWNDYPSGLKRGRFITKVDYEVMVQPGQNPDASVLTVARNRWDVIECPVFTQDRDFLLNRIIVNY